MSDDGTMATGAPNERRNARSKLPGGSGEAVHSGPVPNQSETDLQADFVTQQPLTAALVALVIGYLLGKVT